MISVEDLIPLSALQHLLYCERQCALIHVERQWVENRYTAEGRIMHERVHASGGEVRGKVRTEFGVALRSLTLGLVGQADVVEYHRVEDVGSGSLEWQPFPVEYKRGRAKKADWDRVQLCAQAICLEEMLQVDVPNGALFYGKTRRRLDVQFDPELRSLTIRTAARLHQMVEERRTPPPIYGGRCDRCSFVESCLPKAVGKSKSAKRYLQRIKRNHEKTP